MQSFTRREIMTTLDECDRATKGNSASLDTLANEGLLQRRDPRAPFTGPHDYQATDAAAAQGYLSASRQRARQAQGHQTNAGLRPNSCGELDRARRRCWLTAGHSGPHTHEPLPHPVTGPEPVHEMDRAGPRALLLCTGQGRDTVVYRTPDPDAVTCEQCIAARTPQAQQDSPQAGGDGPQTTALTGSTEMTGMGIHTQERAVDPHHLDCPWRPVDIEQREDRIERQGNLHSSVEVVRYDGRQPEDGVVDEPPQ